VDLKGLKTRWGAANADGSFGAMELGALCLYATATTLAINNITTCQILLSTRLYFDFMV